MSEENKQIQLTEHEIEILKLLKDAPLGFQHGYYLAGLLNVGYHKLYPVLRILESKGAVTIHKTKDNKSLYIVIPGIKEKIDNKEI